MTPDFLNPSPSSSFSSFSHDIIEQKDQYHHHQPRFKFVFSQYNEEGSSSLSPSPTSFDSNLAYQDQDHHQTSDVIQAHDEYHHNHQEAVIKYEDITGEINQYRPEMNGGGGGSVMKYWMSSKMRVMQKMSNYPESEKPAMNHKRAHHHRSALEKLAVHRASHKHDKPQLALSFVHTNGGGGVRVCSDCNTTTTPLWRSGPRGPKSLCNACGIRQRKARRALAEAAAAGAGTVGTDFPTKSYNINGHYSKGKFKLKASSGSPSGSKLCFREFAGFGVSERDCSALSGVFPQDVAEAAVLLMQLSCHGFVHS